MRSHGIPFQEEVTDNEVAFLLPKKVRPHAWKLVSAGADTVQRLTS
jgi:hypothetical protein